MLNTDRMYDENVKMLANAIVIRACEDYKEDARLRIGVEKFIMSEWFWILTRGRCDPRALINHLQEVVNNGEEVYPKKKFFGNW